MKPIADLMNLQTKTAIITGGAMGIGAAIVQRLHEAGANVVIADLDQAKAQSLATALNQTRPNSASAQAVDVSNDNQVTELVNQTVAQFGGIDILVNNAGIYPFASLADMTGEQFMKVIQVNLYGVFLTTKAASQQMKQQGRGGRIINISSVDALHPSMVGLAHYDASKHGVWGFTKNTALELAAANITVNAVAPGGIATPGTGMTDTKPAGYDDFLKALPFHRMGEADEIGRVVLFLASELSSYMTGSQIVVDGGQLLT